MTPVLGQGPHNGAPSDSGQGLGHGALTQSPTLNAFPKIYIDIITLDC